MSAASRSVIDLTPEQITIFALRDCLLQLERAQEQIEWTAFAAKSVHLAMQAALTAALAGSTNTGAHPKKLREEWTQALQGVAPWPDSDWVMPFSALLTRAMTEPLPWSQRTLAVSNTESEALEHLTAVRNAVEHPKQAFHVIGATSVMHAIAVASKLAVTAALEVSHHYDEDEILELESLSSGISRACALLSQSGAAE